ncbi:MAG: hypothetical protein IKT68_01545, partial [Clostridia bacterium]|nr:hypothetical protein [Clostridia bacterium]
QVEDALIRQSGAPAPAASAATDPSVLPSVAAQSYVLEYVTDDMEAYDLISTAENIPDYKKPTVFEAGDDYEHVVGENMFPTNMKRPFNDKYCCLGAADPFTELGTTKEFNICPPENGVTVLLLFTIDCSGYVYLRRFFNSLATCTWLDNPRIRIIAVECGGNRAKEQYVSFVKKYAGSCYNSIEWYYDSYEGIAMTYGYYLGNKSADYPWYDTGGWNQYVGMIISRDEMLDDLGCLIPAYAVKFVASHTEFQHASVLKNTLDYIMPGFAEDTAPYEQPAQGNLSVNMVAQKDYGQAQEIYDLLMDIRLQDNANDDMVLDARLTECAMQRAAELAYEYSHNRPTGESCFTVFDEMGYSAAGMGENAGYFFTANVLSEISGGERMMKGWYESDGHRENMLNPNFNRIGIGYVTVADVTYGIQMFDTNPADYDYICTRTDAEEYVFPITAPADFFNLRVKTNVTGQINQPYRYNFVHVQEKTSAGYETYKLVPLAYDTVAKAEDGSVVANVAYDAETHELVFTPLSTKKGTMQVTIAEGQTITITVQGQQPHTEHEYTNWGIFYFQFCAANGYMRRYCFCGHYEQGQDMPHIHYTYMEKGKDPTCSQTGLTNRIYCRGCWTEFVPQQVLEKLPHTEAIFSDPVEATCSQSGWQAGIYCTVCWEITQQPENIGKAPHTEVILPGREATCKQYGITEGKKCTTCGKVTVEQFSTGMGDHKWETSPAVPATCKKTGLTEGVACSTCGTVQVAQQTTPKADHNKITIPGKAATCTAPGYSSYMACEWCGLAFSTSFELPQRGHNIQEVETTPATCKEAGHTAGKMCLWCGLVEEGCTPIPKLKHEFTDANDTDCNLCGQVISRIDGDMGDINGDGSVGASDALEVLKMVVGKLMPTEQQQLAADVNQDGTVSAGDALEILKYTVGKPSALA